jgi:DhnA family fructose-bisphosphate aldolase class Ia
MNNKLYRMNELLNPDDGRSLVVDTSRGLVLGVLPGLEHFSEAIRPVLPLLDGIVTSPGQARQLGSRPRQAAALLVRADWTNALRGNDFVLPPETIQYVPLLSPADALDLGASALVMNFILGHEEDIEARCLQQVVSLSFAGQNLGMPLLVEVQPIGPRVVLPDKAIELGVSYALEGGADGFIVPWPGAQPYKEILTMCNGLPVWIKPASLEADNLVITEALQLGAAGLWLDERLFTVDHPADVLQALKALVHAPAAA